MDLVTVDFTSFKNSINNALDAINARDHLSSQTAILIKPNLINSSPHPITTSPECCEAVIEYIQKYSQAEIEKPLLLCFSGNVPPGNCLYPLYYFSSCTQSSFSCRYDRYFEKYDGICAAEILFR